MNLLTVGSRASFDKYGPDKFLLDMVIFLAGLLSGFELLLTTVLVFTGVDYSDDQPSEAALLGVAAGALLIFGHIWIIWTASYTLWLIQTSTDTIRKQLFPSSRRQQCWVASGRVSRMAYPLLIWTPSRTWRLYRDAPCRIITSVHLGRSLYLAALL